MVGETTLRVSYSPWRKAWFLAGSHSHGWAGRNAGLMQSDFRTLRELRDALEAAFSVDPPERAHGCLPASALTKIQAGHYKLDLGEGREAEVHKVPEGWEVRYEETSLRFKSLYHVRRSALKIRNLPAVWPSA